MSIDYYINFLGMVYSVHCFGNFVNDAMCNVMWQCDNKLLCYDELGCLNINKTWYDYSLRPFNALPENRSKINTTFILYTRINHVEGQIIKAQNESIKKSYLDIKHKTKVIIHGFVDAAVTNWVKLMTDEILKAEEVNVIVVDWGGGSLPTYRQACANIRLVGLEVAYFINYLMKSYKMPGKNFHIIGHSLGAHTAGYAGSMIPGLGRITGLDPAKQYFQGMPTHVRLDKTDAELVDVIHTDITGTVVGYGISNPCGHFDFYPNGGQHQPGCANGDLVSLTELNRLYEDEVQNTARRLVACSHSRAIELFIDSINSQCPFIGRQCSNFEQFKNGNCYGCTSETSCVVMGYKAGSTLGLLEKEAGMENKYFLITGQNYSYCQQHYRVRIDLAKPPNSANCVTGRLHASIYSYKSNKVINVDLNDGDAIKLTHGTIYTTVFGHPVDLAGNIQKVEIKWIYDNSMWTNCGFRCLGCNKNLYVKSLTVEQLALPDGGHKKRNVILFPKGNKDYVKIKSNEGEIFSDEHGDQKEVTLETSK